MKKEIFSYMPLSCGLGHRRTSALQGFHIAVATHNCTISSKSKVNPPGIAPCIPPHKPSPYTPIMHHSPCLPDNQIPFLQAGFHVFNLSLRRPTHWATTSILDYGSCVYFSAIMCHLRHLNPTQAKSSAWQQDVFAQLHLLVFIQRLTFSLSPSNPDSPTLRYFCFCIKSFTLYAWRS